MSFYMSMICPKCLSASSSVNLVGTVHIPFIQLTISELQLRGGIEDYLKIIFLISQRTHML